MNNDFDLYITWDWNCEYCIVNTHNNPKIHNDDLIKSCNNIPEKSVVKIIGGEPGMASKNTLEMIFNILDKKNCTYTLATNGLFLKRYPEYVSKFSAILYHCSENLLEHDFERYENIDYQITVTDNNLCNLEDFLASNKDLIFNLFAASRSPIPVKGNTLSKKNAIKILMKYRKQLTKECIKSILGRCGSMAEVA
jgi:hypothetical protein